MRFIEWTPLIVVFLVTGCSTIRGVAPQRFDSPEQAVSQLEQVVASVDTNQARRLFGSDGDYLLDSGDRVLDEGRAKRFVEMFNETHALKQASENEYTLVLGANQWPFPVPLVKTAGSWSFDAEAGREEVLARRIGENEFTALETARAVYLAQRAYAARDWDGSGTYQYAEKLVSSAGKRDGLYWPLESQGDEESPLTSLVAQAAQENYVITPGGKPQPFHGYFYKLMYSPVTAGDAIDALSRPGYYWLIASPATWNESGVMTFALNERGWIYQKNLGSDFDYDTLSAVAVDETWTRVE